VNDDFDGVVYPASLFGFQERVVVRTESPPPSDSTKLSSPREEFVGLAWWIEFILTVDIVRVSLAAAAIVFVWWVTRSVRG
jgi:hypothetical protein